MSNPILLKRLLIWTREFNAILWGGVVIFITATTIYFAEKTLSEIEAALPLQVLEQKLEVSKLNQELADLVRIVQVARVSSVEDQSTVAAQIDVLVNLLQEVRSNYKLDNLVGAAAIHAVITPALFDIKSWVTDGVPGVDLSESQILSLVDTRATDAYSAVKLLSTNVDQTALSVVRLEASKIRNFRKHTRLLLVLFILVAALSVFFLWRRQTVIHQLFQREATLTAFLDNAPMSISIKDPQGRYLRLNPYASNLFEVNEDQVKGQLSPSLVAKDLAEVFSAEDGKVFKSGQPSETEFTLETEQGNRTFRHIRFPVFGPDNRIIALGATGVDVTLERRNEQRFRDFADIASDYLWEMDDQLRYSFVSVGYEEVTGIPSDEILGKTRQQLWQNRVKNSAQRAVHFDAMHDQESFTDHDITWSRPDTNAVRYFRISGKPLIEKDGQFIGYRGVVNDITAQKQIEKQIEYFAFYDSLTELPNRKLLLDRVKQALTIAHPLEHCGAIMFLDLDHFKNVNDSLGHSLGDELLKQVAMRIRDEVQEEDTVSRIGGDEFVIMMLRINESKEQFSSTVHSMAQRITKRLAESFQVSDHKLQVTVSIGIAFFPESGSEIDDILKNADTAMYRAKEEGRNTISYFSPDMQLAADHRLNVQNIIHRAVIKEDLIIEYQPQIDINGHIVGAEALLRINNPDGEMLMPKEFIRLAENSGQIVQLGDWVFKNTTKFLRDCLSAGADPGNLHLAINVSAKQFHQQNFVQRVAEIIQTAGVDPVLLEIELTESVIMIDVESAISKMKTLKELGLRISLDDFGTGYSSLAYLKRLPLDMIKIDQSFVREVATNESDAIIVAMTLTLADRLGLKVVAEGVESEAVFKFLRERNCSRYQGYLFHRPMSGAKFFDLIGNNVQGGESSIEEGVIA
ncbi:MAG: diguanylate cyclase (GGDEF)-like protein/PAS domain S-box-containing protein [Gammaproteobacteria bacterium]|jgi:diguanylate cyclase (GGDEF)-like protein/PAS domain S-box-containing protein